MYASVARVGERARPSHCPCWARTAQVGGQRGPGTQIDAGPPDDPAGEVRWHWDTTLSTILCMHFYKNYPRGGRNIFPTPIPKPPAGPRGPTPHPPHTLRIDYIFDVGAKIQIYSAKPQICFAKIQIFGPKFKYLNFCTTKNLPFCMSKTPGAARVPGLGLVNRVPKKLRGHPGKKNSQKSRNRCDVNGRGCGCPILELIQTLKECLLCHHYCAQLCAHMRTIVTASGAVSNRESQYPRRRQFDTHPPPIGVRKIKTPTPWNWFSNRLRLRTDIFKTTKSDPGSMEITKTEELLYFDC